MNTGSNVLSQVRTISLEHGFSGSTEMLVCSINLLPTYSLHYKPLKMNYIYGRLQVQRVLLISVLAEGFSNVQFFLRFGQVLQFLFL